MKKILAPKTDAFKWNIKYLFSIAAMSDVQKTTTDSHLQCHEINSQFIPSDPFPHPVFMISCCNSLVSSSCIQSGIVPRINNALVLFMLYVCVP